MRATPEGERAALFFIPLGLLLALIIQSIMNARWVERARRAGFPGDRLMQLCLTDQRLVVFRRGRGGLRKAVGAVRIPQIVDARLVKSGRTRSKVQVQLAGNRPVLLDCYSKDDPDTFVARLRDEIARVDPWLRADAGAVPVLAPERHRARSVLGIAASVLFIALLIGGISGSGPPAIAFSAPAKIGSYVRMNTPESRAFTREVMPDLPEGATAAVYGARGDVAFVLVATPDNDPAAEDVLREYGDGSAALRLGSSRRFAYAGADVVCAPYEGDVPGSICAWGDETSGGVVHSFGRGMSGTFTITRAAHQAVRSTEKPRV